MYKEIYKLLDKIQKEREDNSVHNCIETTLIKLIKMEIEKIEFRTNITTILEKMKEESENEPFPEKSINIVIRDNNIKKVVNSIFGKENVENLEFDENNKNRKELYEDYCLELILKRNSMYTL